MKRRKAFTLIELLVVISIIALLISILLPSLNQARETAKRILCLSGLKQMGLGILMYADDNKGFVPEKCVKQVWQGNYIAFFVGTNETNDPTLHSTPVRLGLLYSGGYISEPEMFYCPSHKLRVEQYMNPMPWGYLPQQCNIQGNEYVRISYSYYPQGKTRETFANTIPAGVPAKTDFPRPAAKASLVDAGKTMVTDAIECYYTDLTKATANVGGPHKKTSFFGNELDFGIICGVFGDGHAIPCLNPDPYDESLWMGDNIYSDQSYQFRYIVDALK